MSEAHNSTLRPHRLFDTHAHLNQPEFDADRDDVIARARTAGVATIVAVGYSAATSAQSLEIARRYEGVYAAVGIQPNDTIHAAADDWDRILALCRHDRVVALGETGLDRYRDSSPLPLQQDFFDRHLRLSQQMGLPFIVHTRESHVEVLDMLREARRRGPLTGVMHSFTGSAETAAECVDLGMYVSFAGMVTFKKSDDLRAVAKTVPPDRILIETDSPYLSPHPLRGRRNEPAHLIHTAECLAEVRGVSIDQFAAQTTANGDRLFNLRATGNSA
ncbi:MAG TPA: TatD family hydrolase [Pirellulales bacterium]|nr:TatD family hydrolase [Pirellulales bacterium]